MEERHVPRYWRVIVLTLSTCGGVPDTFVCSKYLASRRRDLNIRRAGRTQVNRSGPRSPVKFLRMMVRFEVALNFDGTARLQACRSRQHYILHLPARDFL